MDRIINIAIDGPSGAGKSTLAKMLAAKLHFIYVDTGAMYRSIALYMLQNGIDTDNSDAVVCALNGVKLSLEYTADGKQQMILNGCDVMDKIRTPEISANASKVSSIPQVRAFLLNLQRDIAKTHSVIMDGRDIGTVILPGADVKIFLTATSEGRAKRRYKELCEKGIDTTYEAVLSDMTQRDRRDSERDVAPAVPAPDSIHFDNSEYNKDEMLEKAMEIIEDKVGKIQ